MLARCRFAWTLLIGGWALAILGGIHPAFAGAIDPILDSTLFGHLNQHLTQCPNNGCGPTATVNSFVFLQNQYPQIYGTSLAGTTEASEIATANALTLLMGTIGPGTNWENLILGKQEYLDSTVPGSSDVTAISQYMWDPCTPAGLTFPCNPQDYINKPDGVKDNTLPTGVDIAEGLFDLRDVEILVGIYRPDPDHPGSFIRTGHYVTVTGIKVNDDDSGTINFIDPDDGKDKQRNFTTVGGVITWTGTTGNTVRVEAEFTEGPAPRVPEPGFGALTGLLLCAGCVVRFHLRRSV